MYWTLAVAALTLHLAFILWVALGALVTKERRWLSLVHIGCLLYAIVIEVALLPCPLTGIERWARRHAGIASYDGDFLPHLLDSLIYPDVPLTLLIPVAVAVCVANLGVYAWRWKTSTL